MTPGPGEVAPLIDPDDRYPANRFMPHTAAKE